MSGMNWEEIEKRLKEIKIKDIMCTAVISTTENSLLNDVADSMLQKKISGMPVLDENGHIKGIITITDLFVAMGVLKYGVALEKGKTLKEFPFVGTIMVKDVLTISQDIDLWQAIDMMIHRGIHTLPVVNEGKLVGVVGRRDVIKHFYSVVAESFARS